MAKSNRNLHKHPLQFLAYAAIALLAVSLASRSHSQEGSGSIPIGTAQSDLQRARLESLRAVRQVEPIETTRTLGGQQGFSFDLLQNLGGDKDLAKAMANDGEFNRKGVLGTNRKVAESSYLAYLEKEADTSIRARVYTQIGILYTTNFASENGDLRDMDKARKYFQLALEEEPERLSRATYQARSHQIGPDMTGLESFEARKELYAWILEVIPQADELWMSSEGAGPPDPSALSSLVSLMEDTLITQGDALVTDAHHTSNVEKYLAEIIKLFPETYAANLATETFEKRRNALNEYLALPISEAPLFDAVESPAPLAFSHRESSKDGDGKPNPASVAKRERETVPSAGIGPWITAISVISVVAIIFGIRRRSQRVS